VGAYINLGSFYLLGIPMAMLLGFVLNMGAKGLWIGVVCGSISQTTLLSAVTFFTDWQKMVCSFISIPTHLHLGLISESEQSDTPMHHGKDYMYLTVHCIASSCRPTKLARERSLSEKATESESRYLME
jgi:hypothetical protein